MKTRALIVLVLVVLAAGCNKNTWDGRYRVDGEWQVFAAEASNDCFMLSVGAPAYLALFESDGDEVHYSFTGSDDGDYCWDRSYTRAGNQLVLETVETRNVFVDESAVCEVEITRERVATFTSSDTFSEVSTVTVTWDSDSDCPPGPGDSCGDGKECCEANFVAAGVRCTDCFVACGAAVLIGDPELGGGLIDGGGSR